MEKCVNTLTIYGPTEDLDRMRQEIEDGNEVISFEKIAPTPEGIIDATVKDILSPKIVEQFGAINVNAWRLKNWGCLSNARNSRIIEESSELRVPELVSEKVETDNVPQEIKEKMLGIRSAMTLTFETDESPNNAVAELSKKYPNILVHFGYDSESEDVCGWAALTNGEVIGHTHYSNCLRTIRVHVEPSSSKEKASLLGFDDEDNSN